MTTTIRRQSSSRVRARLRVSDPATEYARGVVAGKLIAGPHVRDACARHLRDLEQGPSRGFVWNVEAADRVYRYFRTVLRLNGGEHEGKSFDLEPWQKFVVGSVFGWETADGGRRFRQAFVETAKGSGKSPLAAGIGMYGLTADGEARAEIYAGATKKDQAMILFRDAVAMVDQSPVLSERLTKSGGNPVWNLAHLPSGSFFRPISSDDGQSGPRPHIALLDEIHEHKSPMVVDMMRAGTKKNRRALIFYITNSGVDRTSVCYTLHEYGVKVSAGDLEDDAFFAYICAVDEGEDPITDEPDPDLGYPLSWAKSNPSIGVTIPASYLAEQVREARGMPAKESIVRRLNFCQWVDAANPWIDGDLWRACEVPVEEWAEPVGDSFLGLDLSATRDLTAAARVVRCEDGTLAAEVRFWTPADTLDERERLDRVPYAAWVKSGHLIAVPGRSIDYGFVVRGVMDWIGEADGLAFDQHRMEDWRRKLTEQEGVESYIYEGNRGHGLKLVRHGQGFAGGFSEHRLWMPRSVSDLETAVMRGTLRVRKNPVLTWNSASAVLESDATDNRKWEKRKSTGRIDGIVALCMAVGLAQTEPKAQTTGWLL
jgi:phage terminase large subunit-like protein